MITDVAIHMVLEAIGGAIMLYALGFCKHKSHQLVVWFVLAFCFSVITVQLVG
jgi:RsiW-degrading membrane proteinase PrsW (M82 family)